MAGENSLEGALPQEIKGDVLIVDDEDTFRAATADLLTREGYRVRQAADAAAAKKLLDAEPGSPPDVLIADIKMPGNQNLELVAWLAQSSAGAPKRGYSSIPVILATGYPEVQTAVRSVGLAVIAYLVKPFEMTELMAAVEQGVRIGRSRRRAHSQLEAVSERLDDWREELGNQREAISANRDAATLDPCTSDAFTSMTLKHILDSLTDLQHLSQKNPSAPDGQDNDRSVCHLLQCPRLVLASEAINQAIATLERTKQSFKSRELADLRHHLERIRSALVP